MAQKSRARGAAPGSLTGPINEGWASSSREGGGEDQDGARHPRSGGLSMSQTVLQRVIVWQSSEAFA